jgi:hypothetical protein
MIRAALTAMNLGHLIGPGKDKLVPLHQPAGSKLPAAARRKNTAAAHEKRIRKGKLLTQHTGLPPRADR